MGPFFCIGEAYCCILLLGELGEEGNPFLYWGGLLRHSEEEGIRLLKICNFCVLFSIAKISIPVGMFRRWLLILAIEQTDRRTQRLLL